MTPKFFSSEQRQRSKEFDRLQRGMLELIDQAPVDEPVLEGCRENIRSVIIQAFLPNLRYGEVHLPKSQQEEGNIPLLPVVAPLDRQPGERLFLSGELIAPTPRKNHKLRSLGDAAIAPAMRCIETDEVFYQKTSGSTVQSVSQPFWVSTQRGSRVAGRPIVMSSMNSHTPTIDRYFALEAMVHARDDEQWAPEKHASMKEWQTWKAALDFTRMQ